MTQSHSWEGDNDSRSQIPRLLWNLKVHWRAKKETATGPYPEPEASNPHVPTLHYYRHINA
jgi:hypothetical protein